MVFKHLDKNEYENYITKTKDKSKERSGEDHRTFPHGYIRTRGEDSSRNNELI